MGFGMGMGPSGCCGCGPNCTIFADNFNRADNANLGSDWTEVSGSWSIASNKLSIPSTNAVATTPISTGTPEQVVKVKVTIANSGSIARVILGYTNSSNYYFAELTSSSSAGTLKLYRRAGGTSTLVRTVAANNTPGTQYLLKVCYVGSIFSCNLYDSTGATLIAVASSFQSITPDDVGLGTGGTVASAILFDDFSVERHNGFGADSNCPECEPETIIVNEVDCDNYIPGTVPRRLQIYVPAGTFANNLCASGCSNAEGTFIVTSNNTSSSGCTWTQQGTLSPNCLLMFGICTVGGGSALGYWRVYTTNPIGAERGYTLDLIDFSYSSSTCFSSAGTGLYPTWQGVVPNLKTAGVVDGRTVPPITLARTAAGNASFRYCLANALSAPVISVI